MKSWNDLRARLNHDLLKNQLIQSLLRLRRIASGNVFGVGIAQECILQVDEVLSRVACEAKDLLSEAENRCGPIQWFARSPLTRLSPADREWMLLVLQDEWTKTGAFPAKMRRARSLLSDLLAHRGEFQRLVKFVPSDVDLDQTYLSRVGEAAESLYELCIAFGHALADLDFGDALKTFSLMHENAKRVPNSVAQFAPHCAHDH